MNTYWVTGQSQIPSTPAEDLPVAIPTRPVHQAAVAPIMQQVASPRPLSACSQVESPGPKPHEWPQAKQQLRKYSTSSVIAIDHSVPPGGKSRRNTEPHPPQPLILGQSSAKTRRKTEPKAPAHMVFSQFSSDTKLCQQQNRPSRQPLHVPEQQLLEEMIPRADLITPPLIECEGNAASLRQSVRISPLLCQEIGQLAAQAEKSAQYFEENAQQARELAKWASRIVHEIKIAGQLPMGSVLEGTPVDPIP